MKNLKHIIDGKAITGNSSTKFDIYNPATGQVIAQMQGANAGDVDLAAQAANKAFATWKKLTPTKRAHLMFAYRDLLYKHLDELTVLLSKEHGKTLADAKGEIMRGIEIVEYCTAINTHLQSDYSSDVSAGIDSYNLRQPLGVCAGITPFNFPVMVAMWMFPIAIACGNTFVLKLSEKNPSAGLRIAELFAQAGFPAGVLNTIVGDKETVDAILHHPDIAAISFVGSTAVGQYIYQQGCKYNKRVQALCGAKNHMVVMPDADLKQACDAVLGAAFGSAGERCMAISVVVAIGDEIADKMIEILTPMIKALKIGQYDEAGVEMGPLISKANQTKVLGYIAAGITQGAELKIDGRTQNKKQGFFVGGCLFDHVKPEMSIYTDEIFGPVLSVVRVANYTQAIKLVNQHKYGNGATIFTRDGDSARKFVMNAEAGMIGVNVPIPVPVANYSFGGWKNSLFGSSAIYGKEGIRFYTKIKTVTSRWSSSIESGAKFHFKSGREHN